MLPGILTSIADMLRGSLNRSRSGIRSPTSSSNSSRGGGGGGGKQSVSPAYYSSSDVDEPKK